MADRQPTIRPTSVLDVAIAGVVGGLTGWLTTQALLSAGASLPVLGPSAWLPIVLLAGVLGWLAWTTQRTVQRRREQLDAATAVTRVRLGKAAVLVGTALGAGYLALALVSLGGWPAPLAQGRALHGALAVMASAGWAVAGWLLERSCRIPRDAEDDGEDEDQA